VSPASVTVLGVDVAARLRNIGVARGVLDLDSGHVRVEEAARGATPQLPGPGSGPTQDAAERVAAWLGERMPPHHRVILALDAPLGWPRTLSRGLAEHRAGDDLAAPDGPDRLWRRVTDQDVHRRFGKLPLEVGANYIARAAWAGLEILRLTRQISGRALPLPLVHGPDDAALETYPAATLRSWLGADPGSYKARDPAPRTALLDRLHERAPLSVSEPARAAAQAVDHTFDAVVCVLAGADFATARSAPIPPEHHAIATIEGWIHVR